MVHRFPSLTFSKEVCNGCLLSKQARKSFPLQSNFTATAALELIHGDLCGPISPDTPSENKYFMLLVNDFTRMMWVYMIKTKNEALSVFKKFKALVENGAKQGIQMFRTDRGGEFCSKEFINFCEDTGIQRHYTAPYSPQQNGVVERHNRTVVAMGRSMLKERNVPSQMWGEAIRHAVYVLNRMPTRSLSRMTPYEAWFGKKPHVDYLRVFGCVANMKVPSVHVKKLDDRSKMVVHFGREPGTKAYRLFDPVTGVVHVSRDVVFEEEKGWNWNSAEAVNSASWNFILTCVTVDTQETYGEFEDVTTDSGQGNTDSMPQTLYSNNNSGSSTKTPQSGSSDTTSSEASRYTSFEASSHSSDPKKYRQLSDIYDNTEAIELAEELLFLGIDEPVAYDQAVKSKTWKAAMQSEIEAIEKNKTWLLTDLPKGHKTIDLKWVFKEKKDTSGEIIKRKAGLVTKVYIQKHDIDYEEVFAPVTRLKTVRLLLALAARNNWKVHHLDVKSAFLNGELQEEVYVSQPKGYVKKGQESKVYRLLKALYGLRQAPRAWYTQLNKCLTRLGFVMCPYEHAVYIKKDGGNSLIIGVYVDDLLITGNNVQNIISFKEQMSREFDMSDLGKLTYYLGLEVDQCKGYIELKQTAYAKKILEKAGMCDCNPVKYPMEHKTQLHKDENGEPVNPTQFKSMVGGPRYLVHTRPT